MALAKAQGALEGAVKDKTNPAFRSRYADLAAVVEAIQAVAPPNGLSYVQSPVNAPDGQPSVGIETMLMHSSGEWILFDPFLLPMSKVDAQGGGSAVTYARRYALSSVFGVAPEDDDGNAASRPAFQAPRPQPRREDGPPPQADRQTGEITEDEAPEVQPSEAARNLRAWLQESGWKFADEHVRMPLDMRGPITPALVNAALGHWFLSHPGAPLTALEKQISDMHARLARQGGAA